MGSAEEAHALGFTKEIRTRGPPVVPEELFRDLDDGLRVADFRVGNGLAAQLGDQAVTHLDIRWRKLTVFTSRQGMGVTGGNPYGFEVGRYGGPGGPFIKGIDLGIVGMKVGGQRRVIIPPELAYGNRRVQEIPPGATLTCDIELLAIGGRGGKPKVMLN